MQSEAARRAGDPSGQGEEPPPEGLGGHDLLAQADAGRPAGEVVGHHLYRQPSAVGGESAGRHVVQPDAVLEVPDGVLDLGVAPMISLQLQGLPVPVGDEAVIAVAGEERQLGTGRGPHPPDDEPHRRGAGLTLEGSVGGLGHIGGAVHPVGDGSPVLLWYGLDEIAQALVLADGDGEADIHLAADGDDGVGIEAAVGPHRESSAGSSSSLIRVSRAMGCWASGADQDEQRVQADFAMEGDTQYDKRIVFVPGQINQEDLSECMLRGYWDESNCTSWDDIKYDVETMHNDFLELTLAAMENSETAFRRQLQRAADSFTSDIPTPDQPITVTSRNGQIVMTASPG